MRYTTIDSPVGELLLAADGTALRRLSFQSGPHPLRVPSTWVADDGSDPVLESPARSSPSTSPASARRSTSRSPRRDRVPAAVWAALLEIPYGETVSYGEIARRLGPHQRGLARRRGGQRRQPDRRSSSPATG